MLNWIKQLLSLEERKASTIMVSFIGFSIIGIYILLQTQIIPVQLVYLILGLGGYICGYNVIPQIYGSNNFSNYNSYGNSQSYNTSNYQNTASTTTDTTINPTNTGENGENGSV